MTFTNKGLTVGLGVTRSSKINFNVPQSVTLRDRQNFTYISWLVSLCTFNSVLLQHLVTGLS